MGDLIVGVAAYFVIGGLIILREECKRKYEDTRKLAPAILNGISLPLLAVNAAILFISCRTIQYGVPSFVLAGDIVAATVLFIGAVLVELKNTPDRYTIRRRHVKYGLQYLSGALLMGIPAIVLLQGMDDSQENMETPQAICVLFLILMFLCISSAMWWKGWRCAIWAYKGSGQLKTGGKEMKLLRKSIRR